jgi:hypothetical protein
MAIAALLFMALAAAVVSSLAFLEFRLDLRFFRQPLSRIEVDGVVRRSTSRPPNEIDRAASVKARACRKDNIRRFAAQQKQNAGRVVNSPGVGSISVTVSS